MKIGGTFKKTILSLGIVAGSMLVAPEKHCYSRAMEKHERRLVTNIPSANRLFIGRAEHFTDLQEKLKTQEKVGLISVVGMAGMGKTQLAKQYAHAHAKSYDVIWWIDANQDFFSQVRELGLKLHSLQGCAMPEFQERTLEVWLRSIDACQKTTFVKDAVYS